MSNHFLKKLLPTLLGILAAIAAMQFMYSKQLTEQLDNARLHNQRLIDPSFNSGFADAVQKALPAVVKIYTTKLSSAQTHPLLQDPVFKRFFNGNKIPSREKIERGLGSGVIVHEDGYILTNNHVIDDVDQIRVMLADGRERNASVAGTDIATDLAVLKIELPDLAVAEFISSNANTRIGDIVLAIGNPYGIGQTVTQGIVSAKGRHGLQLNTYENYIQTDAAINQGNSGGALINTRGKVIGINNALYSRSGGSTGIGFAIPAETALHVLSHIINYGQVVRGWLGISVENITPALAELLGLTSVKGILVTDVSPNGPAAQAGIVPGDILTHINQSEIVSGNLSMHQVAQTLPGTVIDIGFVRDGLAQTSMVTLGERPAPAAMSR